MLTDPIADMLTRIRNANKALHETAEMPASKQKEQIARILTEEGYVPRLPRVERARGAAVQDARRRAQVRPRPPARVTGTRSGSRSPAAGSTPARIACRASSEAWELQSCPRPEEA